MKNKLKDPIYVDRMRYTKNTRSSMLCYLSILFDVFYFVNIYSSDVGSWYYNILVGGSIVYNLLFMLFVFLASEGVKNYVKVYSYVLMAIGALQFGRMCILPLKAMNAEIVISGAQTLVMSRQQGTYALIWLALSAVCLIAAAVINMVKCFALKSLAKENSEAKSNV